MISSRHLFAALATLGVASTALALDPGARVADFKLIDHEGKRHQLYGDATTKAVVVMIQGNGCPIARHAMHSLRDVRQAYESKGVEFMLLNANIQDSRELVQKEVSEFGIDFPILLDRDQNVARGLKVTRTAEILLIDPRTQTLKYRGPIDDRLSYEAQRPVKHHYLTDALDATLAGKPVAKTKVDAPGCLVNILPPGEHAKHDKHDHG